MSIAVPLTVRHAEEALAGRPLVTLLAGTLPYVKEVRDKCLAAGIPALATAPEPGRG